jgi:hypothetical protein
MASFGHPMRPCEFEGRPGRGLGPKESIRAEGSCEVIQVLLQKTFVQTDVQETW